LVVPCPSSDDPQDVVVVTASDSSSVRDGTSLDSSSDDGDTSSGSSSSEDELAAFSVGAAVVDMPQPSAMTRDKIYTGAASPAAPDTIHVVGGCRTQFGGWGAYEIDRRAARRALGGGVAHPGSSYYGGRTYITGLDAVESIFGNGQVTGGGSEDPPALTAAIERLHAAISTLENAAGTAEWWDQNPVATLTSVNLPAIAAGIRRVGHGTPEQVRDAVRVALDLYDTLPSCGCPAEQRARSDEALKIGVELVAAETERSPLLGTCVECVDVDAVRSLEDSCRGYAGAIEKCNARAAAFVDQVAVALEQSVLG